MEIALGKPWTATKQQKMDHKNWGWPHWKDKKKFTYILPSLSLQYPGDQRDPFGKISPYRGQKRKKLSNNPHNYHIHLQLLLPRTLIAFSNAEPSWWNFLESIPLCLLPKAMAIAPLRSVPRGLSCDCTLLSEIRMPQGFTIHESGAALWCTLSPGSPTMEVMLPLLSAPPSRTWVTIATSHSWDCVAAVPYPKGPDHYCTLLHLGPHFCISPLHPICRPESLWQAPETQTPVPWVIITCTSDTGTTTTITCQLIR